MCIIILTSLLSIFPSNMTAPLKRCINVSSISAHGYEYENKWGGCTRWPLQSMCEAVSVSIWHLPHIGLSVIPSLKKWCFKWQCPDNKPVTSLVWDLLNFKELTFLLAESLERNLFAWLCPGMDCQYSWCLPHILSLMTHLGTLSDIPQADSGPINGCSRPLFC
jgi:hypothetical protein